MINREEIIKVIQSLYDKEHMMPDFGSPNYYTWLTEINVFIDNHSNNTIEEISTEINKRIKEEKENSIEKWLSIFAV